MVYFLNQIVVSNEQMFVYAKNFHMQLTHTSGRLHGPSLSSGPTHASPPVTIPPTWNMEALVVLVLALTLSPIAFLDLSCKCSNPNFHLNVGLLV